MNGCPTFVPNLWKPLLCSNCLQAHSSVSAPTSPTSSHKRAASSKPSLASPIRLSPSQKQPTHQTTREHRRSNSSPIPANTFNPPPNVHLSHHHALPHSESSKRKKDSSAGACDSFIPQRWRPSVCMHCFEPLGVHNNDFSPQENYMTLVNMDISAPLPEEDDDDGNGEDDINNTLAAMLQRPTTPRLETPTPPPHPLSRSTTPSTRTIEELVKVALTLTSPDKLPPLTHPLSKTLPSTPTSAAHPLSKSTPGTTTPRTPPPNPLVKSTSRGSLPLTQQPTTPRGTQQPTTPRGTPQQQPTTPRGLTPRPLNSLTPSPSFSSEASDDDPFRGFEELQDTTFEIKTTTTFTPHSQGFDISTHLESVRNEAMRSNAENPYALRPLRSARGREQFFSQYKDDDDDWDGGVDMDAESFEAMADYTYVNNKIMEIASVRREAEKSQRDMRDPTVMHALFEILAAKQKQIQRALDRDKISEQDHNKLLERLNAVKDLLQPHADVEIW